MHLILALLVLSAQPDAPDVGSLVRSLWLVQRHGSPEGTSPANDQRVKAALSKALAKDGIITLSELGNFMDRETFDQLAGADAKLDPAEIARAVDAATPESRTRLAAKLREHADYLSTTLDMMAEPHREAGERLARWIAANYEPGKPLHVTVICTGNSRRSILGSSMGNLAAAYYGLPEVRFHSGGTAPTAFNPRTVAALRAVGFSVEPTGAEAERGEPKTENPIYRVSWGEGFEAEEFSKRYDVAGNPQGGFAALMVCSEADAGCPFVKGAALRLSTPYLDPKIYDDGAYEAAKYAERRDDVARLMLAALMQARSELAAKPSRGR
ncbi:hypothetical protein [Paludisphaera mucosa]|uniref:Protein-tyrosine-phosphatase n=1 Tax=Paludisphaera mucosa TaxID=3030827 RepID=A0ABT6FK93_9BACT|nr:hypothetical protein [Paludisphaera mucosa]MDG3007995.1 hypothetical protein [Paludisphaera mucosa]